MISQLCDITCDITVTQGSRCVSRRGCTGMYQYVPPCTASYQGYRIPDDGMARAGPGSSGFPRNGIYLVYTWYIQVYTRYHLEPWVTMISHMISHNYDIICDIELYHVI